MVVQSFSRSVVQSFSRLRLVCLSLSLLVALVCTGQSASDYAFQLKPEELPIVEQALKELLGKNPGYDFLFVRGQTEFFYGYSGRAKVTTIEKDQWTLIPQKELAI
jgi:hypothetical protein